MIFRLHTSENSNVGADIDLLPAVCYFDINMVRRPYNVVEAIMNAYSAHGFFMRNYG